MKVYQAESRHFCDDPVCPDPSVSDPDFCSLPESGKPSEKGATAYIIAG